MLFQRKPQRRKQDTIMDGEHSSQSRRIKETVWGQGGVSSTGGVATSLSVISIKERTYGHIHPGKMMKIPVVGK